MKQKQADLAHRVREVREDLYGEYGAQFLADALELPFGELGQLRTGRDDPRRGHPGAHRRDGDQPSLAPDRHGAEIPGPMMGPMRPAGRPDSEAGP